MTRTRRATITALLALVALASPPARAASDPRAEALARETLEAMGGTAAWDATRFLEWRFFGRRLHHWDRATGDVRIESDSRLVLLNVHSKEGRVWENGAEITDPGALREALDVGYAWWVNDSYWLLMPFKLLDPGVTLTYGGEDALPDGRAADRITLTFGEGVGLTPENRYEVWIARDTKLVEQWAYYPTAADPEPKFTLPWADWKTFGRVRIATNRGRDMDWEIATPDTIPREMFEQP